ncbi:MAG: arylsulfatase [Bacteroidetes bacterium]|nr:arylsulfatase [Bacteroidota bacterium]
MKKNVTFFFLLSVFLITLLIQCSTVEEDPKPPNIILIMADDLGYHELGCYGQEIIKTPRIDQLAQEGMRFTQFYAGSPVCAPSRCVLLTGKHTGHSYVRDNYELGGYTDETEGGQLPLPPGTQTIATLLKGKGYVTAVIGKWGLGGPGSTGVPNKQGFDYFYGYLCQKQAHNYYPTHLWENEQWDTLNNVFFMAHQRLQGDPDDPESYKQFVGSEYSLDMMRDKALKFIQDNKDTSFFLYLPVTVPHLAIQVPEDEPSLAEYRKMIPDTPYVGNRGYLPYPYPRAGYAAMITRMDREIGKIIDLIKELDLDDNTIVLFTSDNGPTYGGIGGSDTKYFESNKPFSGLKGSVYEGGIRVPFIVRWPGKIHPGAVSNHMAAFQDMMPSLVDIADGSSVENIDGISFLPELLSEEQPQHEYLYWEFPAYGGQQAVRMGIWKAVRENLKKDPNAPIELFNLREDTAEINNVAAQNPIVVKQIAEIMRTARTPSDTFAFPALDSLTFWKRP